MSLRRTVRAALGSLTGNDAERIRHSGRLRIDDIEPLRAIYRRHGATPGSPWDPYRDAHLQLPGWFRQGLDPLGPDYAAQQHRLWREITGVDRPYDPAIDEAEEAWAEVDPVRRPGHFGRRDPAAVDAAADHVIATGMLMKHSGLRPGDRALEYGAGFAQTALMLARLGVQVDTVDISERLCGFVRQQAEFFQVPLTPHVGRFGLHPRPGERYRLVWFYESFHHCVDFLQVVPRLHDLLADGGRVILAGEPVVEHEYAAVPYPWGVRLHSEVLAMMRQTRWFELGFSEAFLFELFVNAGFVAHRVDCEPSPFGRLYVFEPRPDEIFPARQWWPAALAGHWGGVVAQGLRVGADCRLPLDRSGHHAAVNLEFVNCGTRRCRLQLRQGTQRDEHDFEPGQRRTLRLPAEPGTGALQLACAGELALHRLHYEGAG